MHQSCFVLVVLPLASSSLFPYTTLFRSILAVPHYGLARGCPRGAPAGRRRGADLSRRGALRGLPRRRRSVDVSGPGGDRKSTRLNSSHLVISYAVFCLKNR